MYWVYSKLWQTWHWWPLQGHAIKVLEEGLNPIMVQYKYELDWFTTRRRKGTTTTWQIIIYRKCQPCCQWQHQHQSNKASVYPWRWRHTVISSEVRSISSSTSPQGTHQQTGAMSLLKPQQTYSTVDGFPIPILDDWHFRNKSPVHVWRKL